MSDNYEKSRLLFEVRTINLKIRSTNTNYYAENFGLVFCWDFEDVYELFVYYKLNLCTNRKRKHTTVAFFKGLVRHLLFIDAISDDKIIYRWWKWPLYKWETGRVVEYMIGKTVEPLKNKNLSQHIFKKHKFQCSEQWFLKGWETPRTLGTPR